MTYPIPDSALENHLAILGKTGSGKSNAAKTMAERLMKAGKRVCAIDPTGTWWGLRLDAAGKQSMWPIVIFGGEHADLPLGPDHGAAVAEAIGTSSTPAILDTRQMTVTGRTKFFTGFAEALIRTNRGELTLMIDEAHLFAPQGKVNDHRSGEMVNAANNLVSLGRGVGIRIIMISQRPAKLHKDSLTQVETLVAMRLIHNLDVDAVRTWIGAQADPEKGRELVASLPSLATGEAWVWSPLLDVLHRSTFPIVASFDSGRPRPDRKPPKLKPIDVDQIATRLTEVEATALANDPARLKKQVAELQRQVATLSKASNEAAKIVVPSGEQLAEADHAGFERGLEEGLRFAGGEFQRLLVEHVLDPVSALREGLKPLEERVRSGEWALGFATGTVPPARSRPPAGRQPAARPLTKERPAPSTTSSAPSTSVDIKVNAEGLTPAKAKILVALRQLEAIGQREADRDAVAWFAGASPKSSGFANNLGALRTTGLIDYPSQGKVSLTEAGQEAAPAVAAPTHESIMALVAEKLVPAQLRILQAAVAFYPGEIGRSELADVVGASPNSSGFANNLGRLRSLGLISYPGQGQIRAADLLFP